MQWKTKEENQKISNMFVNKNSFNLIRIEEKNSQLTSWHYMGLVKRVTQYFIFLSLLEHLSLLLI